MTAAARLQNLAGRIENVRTHIGVVGDRPEAVVARLDELGAIARELRALAVTDGPRQWVVQVPNLDTTLGPFDNPDEARECGASLGSEHGFLVTPHPAPAADGG